jgi:hypothetical protein
VITVGFNATRRYRNGKWVDIALLVGGTLVLLGVIAWAFGLF